MSLMWKFMCTFHHCSALFGCNASCSVTFRLCGIWCLCFIYIDTLLLTPSSTVEGDTWMRLKIYHIRVVVNLIYIFWKKTFGNQCVFWGLGELQLHVCLCVCGQTVWLEETAPRALWGEKTVAWYCKAFPVLHHSVFVSHSQVYSPLEKKKKIHYLACVLPWNICLIFLKTNSSINFVPL